MKSLSSLVIGAGEIGRAVQSVVGGEIRDIKPIEIQSVDVLHICFPFSDDFINQVVTYQAEYQPISTIIYSTVPIGTTKQLDAVHSPVEGKHPDLEMSLRQMTRWIGYNSNKSEAQFYAQYFNDLGINTRLVPDTDFTEALKLLSTTEYGVAIEFARYKAMIADRLEMDYELMKQWNQDYNRLYRDLGYEKQYQKYVLDAPEGPKGGHCVTPNAILLHEQFPSDFTRIVGEL